MKNFWKTQTWTLNRPVTHGNRPSDTRQRYGQNVYINVVDIDKSQHTNINPFQAEHHDLNLTCKVAHIGFEDGDVTSASALVNLTPEFVKMLAEGSEDGLNADASVSKQPKSVRRALIIS